MWILRATNISNSLNMRPPTKRKNPNTRRPYPTNQETISRQEMTEIRNHQYLRLPATSTKAEENSRQRTPANPKSLHIPHPSVHNSSRNLVPKTEGSQNLSSSQLGKTQNHQLNPTKTIIWSIPTKGRTSVRWTSWSEPNRWWSGRAWNPTLSSQKANLNHKYPNNSKEWISWTNHSTRTSISRNRKPSTNSCRERIAGIDWPAFPSLIKYAL